MKRTTSYFTLILTIFLYTLTFAQTKSEEDKNREVKGIKEIQFGIRSGLNLSFPSGNLVEASKSRFGYHVGTYIQIPSKKKAFVYEIGLFYSQEGFKAAWLYSDSIKSELNLPAIGNGAPTRIHVEYLDAQFIFKDNQNEKLSAYGGLEVSYLLSSEIYQEYKDSSGELIKYRSTKKDGLSTMAMGAIIGLEYHVNHYLHINGQYTYPFTRMISAPTSDVKNSTIKLGVGFTF